MNRLIVHLGSLPLFELPLREGATSIGRARDNEVTLTLPEIAEHHAVLTLTPDAATLRAVDTESLLVNGRAVSEAMLSPGDRVILGGYRLQWLGEGMSCDRTGNPTAPLEGQPKPAEGSITRLAVIAGRDAGLEVPFQEITLLVGRAPDCDLVLLDETVSWRHACFEWTPEGVRVRDLGSLNGTFLDDRRVEAVLAGANCSIRAGRTVLRLMGEQSEPAMSLVDLEMVGLAELVGRSAPMQKVYARLREAGSNRMPVLLLGETGTGKELAARAIHSLGPSAGGPFVPVNCAALPRELMEAEMFGHARGAFTGATAERRGAFEEAEGGTIFLDEISELPNELQAKLLRVIEDGYVPRLGGGGRRIEFRVLAASNRDLAGEVESGRFRRDLYFRLAGVSIRMPALVERLEDLSELIRSFLTGAEQQTGVPGSSATLFEEGAFIPLRAYSWPGNVRELRNLIFTAAARRPAGVVDQSFVVELLAETPFGRRLDPAAPRSLEEIEREAILNALRDCNGRRRAAARRLGIAESTLYEKIRRYGLADDDRRGDR